MKKLIIISTVFLLVIAAMLAAFNSRKGEPASKEGMIEKPLPANDSLLKRGEKLVNKANYSNTDLEALKLYLNKN